MYVKRIKRHFFHALRYSHSLTLLVPQIHHEASEKDEFVKRQKLSEVEPSRDGKPTQGNAILETPPKPFNASSKAALLSVRASISLFNSILHPIQSLTSAFHHEQRLQAIEKKIPLPLEETTAFLAEVTSILVSDASSAVLVRYSDLFPCH